MQGATPHCRQMSTTVAPARRAARRGGRASCARRLRGPRMNPCGAARAQTGRRAALCLADPADIDGPRLLLPTWSRGAGGNEMAFFGRALPGRCDEPGERDYRAGGARRAPGAAAGSGACTRCMPWSKGPSPGGPFRCNAVRPGAGLWPSEAGSWVGVGGVLLLAVMRLPSCASACCGREVLDSAQRSARCSDSAAGV